MKLRYLALFCMLTHIASVFCTEQHKRVLLVVAHNGFQPLEYLAPKQILQKAGYTVETASDKSGIAHAAYTKDTAHVDYTLKQVPLERYDAIIFVGGPGALNHLDNSASHTLIKKAYEIGKIVGAICVAPRILAHAGILKNKNATGWDGDNKLSNLFKSHDIQYVRGKPVIVDGAVITAVDPSAASAFGHAIVNALNN